MAEQWLEQAWKCVESSETALLATGVPGSVTMRTVSPVRFGDGILIFTDPHTRKYQQLQQNPVCCLSIQSFFLEAKAEFLGDTMAEENRQLRQVYENKFAGAFAEGQTFGGQGMEFILLHPTRVSGWAFADGVETEDGMPNLPFEVTL